MHAPAGGDSANATPARLITVLRSLTGLDLSSPRGWWTNPSDREPDLAGPPANRRLTALTGTLVLPLAALVLLTGLWFGTLWRVHFFLGFLLLPIVLLKLSSTTYRMVRYYLRLGLYRQIRPPYPIARASSPLLALSVVVLFASGIVMWLTHSQRDPWGWLHTDAAIVFSAIVLLHLGLYLPEAVRAARADLGTAPRATTVWRRRRFATLAGAAAAGLALAVLTVGPSRFPVHAHRAHHARPARSVRLSETATSPAPGDAGAERSAPMALARSAAIVCRVMSDNRWECA